MKNKIFEKMRDYGWNLEDNTNEDFEKVYNTHYNFVEKCYDLVSDSDVDKPLDFNKINKQEFIDMVTFMSDFLRAVNDTESEKR